MICDWDKRGLQGLSIILSGVLFLCSDLICHAESKPVIVSNKYWKLTYNPGKDYGIREISTIEGESFILTDHSLPWDIHLCSESGVRTHLDTEKVIYKGVRRVDHGVEKKLIFTWQTISSPKTLVKMSVTLNEEDELPQWSLDAEVPEGFWVETLTFPKYTLPLEEDMSLLMPVGYGIEMPIRKDTQAFTQYPSGSGTMQLLMVHTAAGTYFLSTRDFHGCSKEFRALADSTSVQLYTTCTASKSWTKKGKFCLPWKVVFGFTKGSWEDTVRSWYVPFTYRTDWGKNGRSRKKATPWIEENDVWIQRLPEDTMDKTLQTLDWLQKPYPIHWYGWYHGAFDTLYPEYFPEKKEVPTQFRRLRAKGARIVPYINGRLWDPSTKSYSYTNAQKSICRDRDAEAYTEVYISKVPFHVMCPSTSLWQTTQKKIIRRLCDSLSVDGVYIDQVACAPPLPCYDTAHPHPIGGGSWWVSSYRDLYRGIRLEAPGHILMTEECAECYIDVFDMLLVVNTPHRPDTKCIPLFPLVYSNRANYTGFSYIGKPITDGTLRYMTAKCLLWGAQLGWMTPSQILDPAATLERVYLQRLRDFRSKHRKLFLNGTLLSEWTPDDVSLKQEIRKFGTVSMVLGSVWKDARGDLFLICTNMDAKAHAFVRPDGKLYTAPPLSIHLFPL